MHTDTVSDAHAAPAPPTVAHAAAPSSSPSAPRVATDARAQGTADAQAMDAERPSEPVAAGSAAPVSSSAEGVTDAHPMHAERAEAVAGCAGEQAPDRPGAPTPPCDAPALGTRIEVLWKISHDDGRVEERWWGAVVQDRLHATVGSISAEHADRFVHILLYDAYGDFEEDISRVAFLPDGTLLDVSQIGDSNKGVLDWRPEAPKHDAQMSLHEFVQANQRDLRAAGVPDDADLAFLSGMPAHVQTHMTAGYRVFADGVKQMLSELSRKHPDGYVVTERDVQEWCDKLRRLT